MIEKFSHSLSIRLLAIFLIMGALFAYGAILGIRWVYTTDQLRELVSGHLSLHVDYVKNDIGDPPNIQRALAITQKVPVDIRISGPDLEWASDERFPPVSKLSFSSSDIFSKEANAWLSGVEGVQFATLGSRSFLKIVKGPYAIVVSSPKMADKVVERHLIPIIMGYGLFLVLLAYLAVRWLFQPISNIRYGASEIGKGNLDHRITETRGDQLGDLADDINKMADNVQRLLDAKRQLLLGISHELRSPLSRLKLALELNDASTHDEGMRDDLQEMEKIIATLLEAERLNERHTALRRSNVSLKKLLDELIDSYFYRDKDRIVLDVPDDVQLNIDETRISLMLKNLISNALRYSAIDDGPVEVAFSNDTGLQRITVKDHGPGIPEQQMDFAGEPFYRGDPSRTRSTGGSGLGLYIAKLVAEAHGGSLSLDRSYHDGACFVIALPFVTQTEHGVSSL